MDRFIDAAVPSIRLVDFDLKSNMDRFIVVRYNEQKKHQSI